MMILVDTCNSYNILQPHIAHHLNLSPTPISQFLVMVCNGSHLQYQDICNNILIYLQDQPFTIPFYLLPIKYVDFFLGMA